MKIVITSPSLDIQDNVSGISSVVNTIVKNNSGVEYIHLLAGRKDSEKSTLSNAKNIISSLKQMISLSWRHDTNLLHLNLALNTKSIYRDFLFFVGWRLFNDKVLLHLHGGEFLMKLPSSKLTNWIIKYLFSHSNAILVLSDLEKLTLKELYGIENSEVFANTIDEIYSHQQILPPIESEQIRFLFLGRLNPSKGIDYILKAFDLLNTEFPNSILNICGAGPLEGLVIEKAKLNKNMVFHGIVGGKQKLDMLVQNDVFLLPSLHGEGLPVALLEAMAVGLLPIVSTDGSMKYIIEDRVTGLFVDQANEIDLYEKMKEVVLNRNLMSNIQGSAKEYIRINFNILNYIEQLNGFYKEIVNEEFK